MQEYKAMLEEAYKNMPEAVINKERFSIPKVRGHIQGIKTVISNFFDISKVLRRDPNHILKYLLKELATPGIIKKNIVYFGRKLSASQINDKIKKYANDFVMCNECGKPDTSLLKEGDFLVLKCQACGSKRNVKSKI